MRDLGTTIQGATLIERRLDGAAFEVVYRGSAMLVIASFGLGWDHVSVSLKHRTPNWYELEHVRRMFFKDDEVAMQLHIPSADHISHHPHCLHLWRPQHAKIPLPPKEMVA